MSGETPTPDAQRVTAGSVRDGPVRDEPERDEPERAEPQRAETGSPQPPGVTEGTTGAEPDSPVSDGSLETPGDVPAQTDGAEPDVVEAGAAGEQAPGDEVAGTDTQGDQAPEGAAELAAEPGALDETGDEGEPVPAPSLRAETDTDPGEDLGEDDASGDGTDKDDRVRREGRAESEDGAQLEDHLDEDEQPPGRDTPQEPTGPETTEVVLKAATAPSPAGTPVADDLTPRKRLLVAMRPRVTRAQMLAMMLCFVLGLAGFLAVRQNQSLGLDSMRQSDLVSLLDNVTERSARVEDETRRLQAMADQLQSGSDRSAAALEAAQQRLEQLGILAGTSPAVGPGIQLTITDPQHKVSAATVLDAVEELRDAGAEAIQIGEVRVVASTAFVNGDRGVRVDGVEVPRPYVLLVIGDSRTLASALDIPGGVLEVLKQDGATGTVETRQTVSVTAVRSVATPRYARPATSAAP